MEMLLFRVWALLALIPFPGEAIWDISLVSMCQTNKKEAQKY